MEDEVSFDATIFEPGRITIPKVTREIYGFSPGTKVKVILRKVGE